MGEDIECPQCEVQCEALGKMGMSWHYRCPHCGMYTSVEDVEDMDKFIESYVDILSDTDEEETELYGRL